MSIYYMSACHDCKKRVTWNKYTEESSQQFHNGFHVGHNTEFSHDFDDDFYSKVFKYQELTFDDNTETVIEEEGK